MSLKAFHVVFITAATLLALGFGIWGVEQYWAGDGSGVDLALGLGSLAVAVALLCYGKYFLRKLKHISYL
jgi:hypothetical protein